MSYAPQKTKDQNKDLESEHKKKQKEWKDKQHEPFTKLMHTFETKATNELSVLSHFSPKPKKAEVSILFNVKSNFYHIQYYEDLRYKNEAQVRCLADRASNLARTAATKSPIPIKQQEAFAITIPVSRQVLDRQLRNGSTQVHNTKWAKSTLSPMVIEKCTRAYF